jgi:DNA polymerase
MPALSIDFETRSAVDLRETGVYPYAADASTDVWCMAWAFDGEEPEIWTPLDRPEPGVRTFGVWPQRILEHIAARGEIRAWNAAFERIIWREILVKRYAWPEVRDDQWVCTMAEAAAMALPRGLEDAALAVGAEAKKDAAGGRLMQKMAKPRKRNPDGAFIWWDDPAELKTLYEYCRQDVRTEQAVAKRLRRLTPMEREVYLLDQRMNDRGVRIDRPLVIAAQDLALEGAKRANAMLTDLTEGKVTAVTQHGRLLDWVVSQGVATDSVDKTAVKDLLESEIPATVRKALIVRSEAGKTSVAKLQAMLNFAGADDRMRGLLLYHGATTGRWAGRGPQPQNYTRGSMDPEMYLPIIGSDAPVEQKFDFLNLFYPPVEIVSSCLRAMLVPEPGKVFVAADYSAIEARVLNWIAGQSDVVELFRQGKDIYRVNAARLFQIPIDEVLPYPHRQTGKFQELGCGFGMGWKKAITAAYTAQYGFLVLTPERSREIVDGYRETHPKVKALWYETEDACKAAVREPGKVFAFGCRGRLKVAKLGGYLCIKLPSGRALHYPAPRIVEAETPWSRDARAAAEEARALAALTGEPLPELPAPEMRPALEFSSVDSTTRQWSRERTYGGKLVENIVQAIARDLMAEAMLRVEKEGFTPVLTVHDEIVSEVDVATRMGYAADSEDIVKGFENLLTELPSWAAGCPVAAAGWMGQRYQK